MLTKEKIQHHISHLQEKHDEVDRRITVETNLPEYITSVLKKEKLALKDEIEYNKKRIEDLNE